MTNRKYIIIAIAALLLIPAGLWSFRAIRAARTALQWDRSIRYLTETGETIGEESAVEALSVDYLSSIFGDNEELLGKLKGLVEKGLSDTPSLNLGEVAAMMVTYRQGDGQDVQDVCAYVIGNFPEGERKLGFHRDGYFRQHLDRRLWTMGNTAVSFAGRDMVLFAEENVLEQQQAVMEAVFGGDIMGLAELIEQPLYFSMVLPNPKRVLPQTFRNHIQALVFKGFLAPTEGRMESIILTPSSRSAGYVLSNLAEMKRIFEITLRTKWKGILRDNEWGGQTIDTWWAHELANASESAVMEKQFNIVRIRSAFERPMVNVVLKGVERMGRDVAQTKATMGSKLDPRLVQARMRNRRRDGYWSDQHKWGPDWPIVPTENESQNDETQKQSVIPETTQEVNVDQG